MSTQTSTRTQTTLVAISNGNFAEGYQQGRDWYFHGDLPCARHVTDADIVDFVRKNVLGEAYAVPLDEKRVTQNIAFLVGWLSGTVFPVS